MLLVVVLPWDQLLAMVVVVCMAVASMAGVCAGTMGSGSGEPSSDRVLCF